MSGSWPSEYIRFLEDSDATRVIHYDDCVLLYLSESTLEYHRSEILDSSNSNNDGSNSSSNNGSSHSFLSVYNNSDNSNNSSSSDQNSNMSSSDEDTDMSSSDACYDGDASEEEITEGRFLIGDGLSRSDDGNYFLVCHMCNFHILHYTNDFHWCACCDNVKLSMGEIRDIKNKHWNYHLFEYLK